jgi:hypothetical protein
MRKSIIVLFTAAFAVFGFAATSSAHTSASGTFKDGPYTATTPDSGCAGNNWAQDLFVRNFSVDLSGSGSTYSVVEKFNKGRFSTFKGDSPGGGNQQGCTTNPNGQIKEGVTGKFSGVFGITVSNGTFNPKGACEYTQYPGWTQCDTAGWIHGFFGDNATYSVDTYSFTYNAGGQGLIYHSWTNADTGNSGDIASS